MKKTIAILSTLLASLTLLAGCSGQSVDKKFACNQDSDCRLSCQYGAVSKSWYIESNAISNECIDGCEEKLMEAKCMENTCKAVDYKGQIDKYCTLKQD